MAKVDSLASAPELLRHLTAEAEATWQRWVPTAETRPARLHAAMRYSLAAGGKRLRPVLLLAAARLTGAPTADPAPAAAALECLHTYTLIHDDLPCMDDSPLRRGRPSCHVQFDEATAVLAGDALLTHAFGILGEAYSATPAIGLGLVADLAVAAGSTRLIGGQMEDMENEGRAISTEQLEYLHHNKTAALLGAALRMGLRCGGHPSPTLDLGTRVGELTGLAFQIVDDILDATADAVTLGKTVGADADNDKQTYVRLHGLAASRSRARQLTAEALAAAAALPGDTTFLRWLVAEMESRIK